MMTSTSISTSTSTDATPPFETATTGTMAELPPHTPPKARPSPSPTPVGMAPPSPPAHALPGGDVSEVQMENYAKVPVFYATTRKVSSDSRMVYGADRANSGRTQYGLSWVSIPRSHKAGELESPSVFTLTFSEDPAKHVVLLEVKAMPKDLWYNRMTATIAASPAKQAFVFIHGYNVTFEDASRRTAQIKYDLGFDGPAILFSWPSHGKEALYLADEANAEWSFPMLADFLVELRRRTGATTIHLIAHSLGNRVLSRAMDQIDRDAAILPKPRFSQVLLAAPDMDADVFRDQLSPRMLRLAQGITLYGSSDDRALQASKRAHQAARAGEGGENLPNIPGIDAIDVTGIDASFLAHSYIGGVSVLGDVAQLICEGKRIAQRFSVVPRRPNGWRLATTAAKRVPRPCRASSP